MTLERVAAGLDRDLLLLDAGNAFGDDLDCHGVTEGHRGADDGDALVARRDVDERAIELDLVDREGAQAAQRRIAGTEIVEDDSEAVAAKLLHRLAAQRAMLDEQTLGDLELDLPGPDLLLAGDVPESGGEGGRTKLDRRQVDRDGNVRPAPRHPAGFAEGVEADLLDHAAFLGDRDHLGRQDLAEGRMVPAQQALEPDDSRPAADHRLEVELQRGTVAKLGAQAVLDLVAARSEEHTSELQSQSNLVCRLLL